MTRILRSGIFKSSNTMLDEHLSTIKPLMKVGGYSDPIVVYCRNTFHVRLKAHFALVLLLDVFLFCLICVIAMVIAEMYTSAFETLLILLVPDVVICWLTLMKCQKNLDELESNKPE